LRETGLKLVGIADTQSIRSLIFSIRRCTIKRDKALGAEAYKDMQTERVAFGYVGIKQWALTGPRKITLALA
jgi:hypothetical protein